MTPSQQQRWQSETTSCLPIGVAAGSLDDADATARLSEELGSAWVVIDSYRFGAAYQRQLKTHGPRVLCLDDYVHAEHYDADVLLNQNAYARADLYARREPSTRLLIGSRYALLRREFRQRAHNRPHPIPRTASRVLVTLGGADPHGATVAVIAALRLIDTVPLDVRVVIGGSSPRAGSVTDPLTLPRGRLEVIHDAPNLADLMSWADMAICGAGITSWELAFMGVPTLALVLADNQAAVAESLEAHQAAVNLGPLGGVASADLARAVTMLAADCDARLRMSRAGQQLIDGQGACRVLQALGLVLLRLERASARDSRMLWEWANDPAVRRLSFNSEPIPWETHEHWFANKLSDPDSLVLIAYEADDAPVGQIRFDCSQQGGLAVSISVASIRRGRGYGRRLVEDGLRHAARTFPGKQAYALIKPDNLASIRLFESAGFTIARKVTINGHPAVSYVWQPPDAASRQSGIL
jgi:UDP-2,4-diacetamido-2,4,6-trideoxy-beta-L-altropyranose hydrolase